VSGCILTFSVSRLEAPTSGRELCERTTLDFSILTPVFRRRPEGDAAAWGEFTAHRQPGRFQQPDQVIADAVDAGFMELAVHAERSQVEFEALAFDAELVGLVIDDDLGKVRLSGQRAQAGEFGTLDVQRAHDSGRVHIRLGKRAGK